MIKVNVTMLFNKYVKREFSEATLHVSKDIN